MKRNESRRERYFENVDYNVPGDSECRSVDLSWEIFEIEEWNFESFIQDIEG